MNHLFDTTPERPPYAGPARARRRDDASSHEAAARMNDSGRTATHQAIVLECLRNHPCETAPELAARLGMDRVEVGRRLSDLLRAGLASKAARRVCRIHGNAMGTWRPT